MQEVLSRINAKMTDHTPQIACPGMLMCDASNENTSPEFFFVEDGEADALVGSGHRT